MIYPANIATIAGSFALKPPERTYEHLLDPASSADGTSSKLAPWRSYYTMLASCVFVKCGQWEKGCDVEKQLQRVLTQHGSQFSIRLFDSFGDMLEGLPSVQDTFYKYRSIVCLLPYGRQKMIFPLPELTPRLVISDPLHIFGPLTIEGGAQAQFQGQLLVELKSPGVFSASLVDIVSPSTATKTTIVVSGNNSIARFEDCSIEQEFPDGKTPLRVIAESGGKLFLNRSVIYDTLEIKEKSEIQITECSIWSRRGSISLRKDGALSIKGSIFISGNEIVNLTLPFERLDIDGCSHRRIFFQNKILSNMDCERLIQQLRISCDDLERACKRAAEGREGPGSALLSRIAGCIRTLSNLARESNDVEKWLASVGCLGIVLTATKSATDDERILEAACQFMWIFASTEVNKRAMASLELANSIVGALSKFGKNVKLAEAGLSTLANLCNSRPGGRYEAKPLREHLGSDEFISLLLQLLSTHRATKSVTDSVLYLLWGISLEGNATPRDRVFALGGLELFLELLRTGSEHAGLRPMICGSLSSVIITSANRKSFIDKGGLEVMSQLLADSTAGIAPEEMLTEVCVFLRSFCYANNEIPSQMFKDLGILKKLIAICTLGAEDEIRTKENAVAALANFASCSEENKIMLRDEGGLKPLLRLLKMVDPTDESLASVKMGVIIAVSHMSSQGVFY
jgi:hypothetical protein